jgi:hypothetical protein
VRRALDLDRRTLGFTRILLGFLQQHDRRGRGGLM